jgi:hypothetical protein
LAARFGLIDRSKLRSIDFGVVGPKRARPSTSAAITFFDLTGILKF